MRSILELSKYTAWYIYKIYETGAERVLESPFSETDLGLNTFNFATHVGRADFRGSSKNGQTRAFH